jgi:hypothetical protein
VLFDAAGLHHRHVLGFVIAFIVLVGADTHMVAGLEVADLCFPTGGGSEFGGAGGGDRGDGLVVLGLDDHVFFVVDSAQDSRERFCGRLVRGLARGSLIPGISPTARIAATGVSDAGAADHDLGQTGQAGHHDQGR